MNLNIFLFLISSFPCLLAFAPRAGKVGISCRFGKSHETCLRSTLSNDEHGEEDKQIVLTRRLFFTQSIIPPVSAVGLLLNSWPPLIANASDGTSEKEKNAESAEITSKIFIELKGLPSESDTFEEDIITIGLFGNDAPQPVSILEELVSSSGYFAKCKPKEIRTLQREQLEANKVYNSCMETQDTKGVNYDLSTVWRIIKDERIDLGAVSGKYVAREYPTFEGSNSFKHDAEGVVSVRRGNDGGFGFTIFPSSDSKMGVDLDETNIVVGKVIGGMDVVRKLNQLPVVQSSSIGYKGLAGGDPSKRAAPSRACRYGSSELYCNEFKPLKKVSIFRTGSLN